MTNFWASNANTSGSQRAYVVVFTALLALTHAEYSLFKLRLLGKEAVQSTEK